MKIAIVLLLTASGALAQGQCTLFRTPDDCQNDCHWCRSSVGGFCAPNSETCPLAKTAAMPALLAFGDSWAWLGYAQLRDVFKAQGVNTSIRAIPGTPAAYWSVVEPNALINAVDAANASHVYMSLGGNDFLEGIPAGIPAPVLYAEMLASTKSVVDKLFKARPHVHVWHFGYEILDWSSSAFCAGFGNVELHGKRPFFCPSTSNVTCMTHAQGTWLQTGYVDMLAAHYANHSHYHGLNLLGTLQVAGGVAGASVGSPNWAAYSPTKYVRKEDDSLGCVHLTPEGYTEVYTELAKHIMPVVLAGDETGEATFEEAPSNTPAREPKAPARYKRRSCLSNPRRTCSVVV